MALYGPDLAYIQAAAFGDLARGAAPEIVRLLRSAAIPVRRVVDAGCGAGVLSAALADAGFDVTGIDSSAELLAVASAAVPQAQFVNGSLYDAELPPCEAILAVGEPLTYHAPNADADALVAGFFQRAAQVLPSGGMLIFDLIETGEPGLSGSFAGSGEDWAVISQTSEDPASRALVREIETFRRVGDLYRRGNETHHVRLFETSELTGQLTRLGFSVRTAQAYGGYRLAPRRRAFFCTRG